MFGDALVLRAARTCEMLRPIPRRGWTADADRLDF
jgi:hypothetical protein